MEKIIKLINQLNSIEKKLEEKEENSAKTI